ncbi:hypothetical protein HCH_02997 [Hahella chejuensis KCTC 2396]|uniref:Uncharacterized protein n=1 Tax=Hahella chejuensis (strain KCTC 2396) TaxID=349521 RepID=Q2SHW0_HAHCH|nr:hypothetical protein [Hahella chejuensis]ABC29764.1 hypothetical protein HCH_02997 [Hahella chejuensis KCTC 2396]
MSDSAYSDLAAGQIDSRNAERRFTRKEEFQTQKEWGEQYFGERINALLITFSMMLLTAVWMITVTDLTRYGVTAAVALSYCLLAKVLFRKKRELQRFREAQAMRFMRRKQWLDQQAKTVA